MRKSGARRAPIWVTCASYDGDAQVQYALSVQRGGTSSREEAARILNLGSVGGRTEFDLDMGQISEYDRVRLNLDAKDFVVTASLVGKQHIGRKAGHAAAAFDSL